MVAVERLEHDRVADPRRSGERLVDGCEPSRHAATGMPTSCSSRFVRSLSLGDGVGDVGRGRGDRRPDPLLVAAVTELDERAARMQAQDRDAAPLRRRDDRRGRGAVGKLLGEPDDPLFQLAHEVEVRLGAINQVVDEPHGELAGGEADVFLGVGIDNVVDAGFARAAGLAAADLGAGKVLQLEGDVLDDVPGQGSLA